MRRILIWVPLLILASTSVGWTQSPKQAPDPLASVRAHLRRTQTRLEPSRVYLDREATSREGLRARWLNPQATTSPMVAGAIAYTPRPITPKP